MLWQRNTSLTFSFHFDWDINGLLRWLSGNEFTCQCRQLGFDQADALPSETTREVLQEVKFRLIPWRLASLERSEDLRRCPQVLCFSANYSWEVWTPTSSHLLEEWVFSSALVKDQLKVWDLSQSLRPSSARSLRSALGYRKREESCSHGNPASSAGTSVKAVPSILGKSK